MDFCERYNITILYSKVREGVGLSKNTVLQKFPDYKYYFILEDDVELLNPEVFEAHIYLSNQLKIPHFSLHPKNRIKKIINRTKLEEHKIIHSLYGSAQFNFFSSYGLEKVGGWHIEFSKYKRYGHTEHSYRFYNQGLTRAPFNIIENFLDGYLLWHEPKSILLINLLFANMGIIASKKL